MPIRRHVFIANVGTIADGKSVSFSYGHGKGIAVNRGGVIKAYVNSCTHMGGPLEIADGGTVFRCRWHQSYFSAETGEAIEGQAPRGTWLKPIEIVVEGDRLMGVLEFPDDPFS
jgi:nitrite reductase/ring-hydroxylating ferredoxin subunit